MIAIQSEIPIINDGFGLKGTISHRYNTILTHRIIASYRLQATTTATMLPSFAAVCLAVLSGTAVFGLPG